MRLYEHAQFNERDWVLDTGVYREYHDGVGFFLHGSGTWSIIFLTEGRLIGWVFSLDGHVQRFGSFPLAFDGIMDPGGNGALDASER